MEYAFLWIGFIGMVLGAAYFASLIPSAREDSKHFYYITFFIALTAAISYFAMATGKGSTLIGTDNNGTRNFFFARYVDWTITTPLLLLDIVLLGLTNPNRNVSRIVAILALDLAMIGFGLLGGSNGGGLRYIFWFLSCVAGGVLLYMVLGVAREAKARGGQVAQTFNTILTLSVVLWSIYPIVFLIGSEGFGAIGAPVEVFLYAVLDLLAKIGFGFILLNNRAALQSASSAAPEPRSARRARI